MILLAILLFIVLLVISTRMLPILKGKYMERLVSGTLSRLPEEYITLNNLLFENNGHSTQIDHVVISPYGVFVIETKGYKGWILGSEDAGQWTQTLYGFRYRFYNPLRQNEGHVNCLRHMLKSPIDIPFIPIVVFGNNATLKLNLHNHIVVNRKRLRHAILCHTTWALGPGTTEWIVQTLQENRILTNRENMKRHKDNVRRRKTENVLQIKRGVCPRCGAPLVFRRGRYGSFYGCSNYPRCRFTSKP